MKNMYTPAILQSRSYYPYLESSFQNKSREENKAAVNATLPLTNLF